MRASRRKRVHMSDLFTRVSARMLSHSPPRLRGKGVPSRASSCLTCKPSRLRKARCSFPSTRIYAPHTVKLPRDVLTPIP